MALFAKSDDEQSPPPKKRTSSIMPMIEEAYEYATPRDFLRIVCISDTHVKHRGISFIPYGDVLIHAGDFSSTGKLSEIEEFRSFMDSMPHKHKVVIAGNHDLTLQTDYYDRVGAKKFHLMLSRREGFSAYDYSLQCRAVISAPSGSADPTYHYLEDSSCFIPLPKSKSESCQSSELSSNDSSKADNAAVKVYGAPWQPEFFNWGFNLPLGPQLKEKWDMIPDDTDILITHGPPLTILDQVNHMNVGCGDLLEAVQARVRPRLHVFGHIHETYGTKSSAQSRFHQ